ncbi:MAG: DUF262 domain-containing protein [Gammaproteobacteria bacterium]|nr:DUF262 domain-containing protein [Gammaproteobacteria bacterium]
MAIVVAETKIKNIKEILNDPHRPLTLPEYQRPYKWSEKHVKQLINDIIKNQGIGKYRIGSVVIHKDKDKDKWDIVDGQQRLVTLSIILYYLGELEISLLSHKFDQEISKKHISNNYHCVMRELKTNGGNRDLKKFISENCEMAYIVIDDLSEAFQFFDSQNARGKPLEAYDLLKAFHLGEMRYNSESEKFECNERWKKRIDNKGDDRIKVIKDNPLHEIFSNHLFRIRSWLMHNSSGANFSKDNIDLFKGVGFSSKETFYPYLSQQTLIESLFKTMGLISANSLDYGKSQYPFQLNQILINGKLFFEYIEMYIQKLTHLREHKNSCAKKVFGVIESYNPRARMRTGDLLVRMLFENTLLFYYDKFGDSNKNHFSTAVRVCFIWSYSIRLRHGRISIQTIDNLSKPPNADNLFYIIENALTPLDVINVYLPPVTNSDGANYLEEIKKLIDDLSNGDCDE